MVPLTDELLTIDYIAQKGYPLLFVTSGKLGSINHTLLSLEAIKNRGIKLDTVLYNLYPTVEDRTIQEDTQLFIQRYLKKDFPETKFCMVSPSRSSSVGAMPMMRRCRSMSSEWPVLPVWINF